MKTILLLLLLSTSIISSAQVKITYDHCNCYDQIESIEPDLNGNYTRYCNGEKVEDGEFISGNKSGIWTLWSLEGVILERIAYSNGILNGRFELFYGSGKPKFSGTFKNGRAEGQWDYYNIKGKVIKSGSYESGKPKGIWKIYDQKGKKAISSYDYDAKNVIISTDQNYNLDREVLENDFNGQFFILMYPEEFTSKNEQPLGGYKLARDYFALFVSIPDVFWDTYTNYHYKAVYSFGINSLVSIELSDLNTENWDDSKETLLPYLIVTNPIEKISRIEHKEIAVRLLESKILETLYIMGPWINVADNAKVDVVVVYVVNDIKNLEGR
ncbi:MAG: hypothetical protein DRI69_01115 [Bacteroidetes bacterium]|nr:MAG: hypothetical protein DRI69_01115 [Bacteroidota bacterium]